MMDRCDHSPRGNDLWSLLRISEKQRETLRTQGFIACERRGSNQSVYKLRFRHHGKQHVRCLGNDPDFVADVQRELDRLQSLHRKLRRLDAISRTANEELRDTKRIITPLLENREMHFHGLAIRRSKAADPN